MYVDNNNAKSDVPFPGVMSHNISFKADTLRGGNNHTVSVVVFTPGSKTTMESLKFLVNKRPFGGSCRVDPLEGKVKDSI